MNNNDLMEGTDKATFLKWLEAESFISPLEDTDINRICQRWIKYKIRADLDFGKQLRKKNAELRSV